MCDISGADTCTDGEEDIPSLPADTLAILQEFYKEQNEKVQNEQNGEIEEDWQLSQFWYDDDTAKILAQEVLQTSKNGRICCLCAPTLYKKLCKIKPDGCEIYLFEYDRRFSVFGKDFVFYDLNDPLKIPDEFSEKFFDIVFADPPFLTEECFVKVSKTVKYLMKEKVIICTGLKMKDIVERLFGARPCKFIPQHKNNLMNAFRCYTNYDSELGTME